MRTQFPGYYRPTPQQFEELWKSATVVPDTNVLLNLYRYSTETRDRLLMILTKYKNRIWLPHQAAKEFHANRLQVIAEQVDAYKKIPLVLDQHKKQIESELAAYKRHPLIDIKEHVKALETAFENAKAALASQQERHPNLLEDDPVLEAITKLFEGQVGIPFDEPTLKGLYKCGEQRYACQIPPGFADAKEKRGDEKYGDLVMWQQILESAKATGKPMILVTDDTKEDWWWRFQGKTFGPRPELVEEMRSVAGVGFYMYRTDQFMEYARSNLREQISEEAINEVRSVRRNAAVAKRFKSHIHEQEMAFAERFRDLLRKKTALQERQVSLDRRLEEITDIQEHFDFRNKEIDLAGNDDAPYTRSHHDFMAERIRIENDRNAVNAELRALTSELSQMTDTLRNLERHGGRIGLTGGQSKAWELARGFVEHPFGDKDLNDFHE